MLVCLQGATLCAVGNELLLYGNDKSDGAVCYTKANDDWLWGVGRRTDSLPTFRKGHAASTAGPRLAVHGGQTLAEGAGCLEDLWYMQQVRIALHTVAPKHRNVLPTHTAP